MLTPAAPPAWNSRAVRRAGRGSRPGRRLGPGRATRCPDPGTPAPPASRAARTFRSGRPAAGASGRGGVRQWPRPPPQDRPPQRRERPRPGPRWPPGSGSKARVSPPRSRSRSAARARQEEPPSAVARPAAPPWPRTSTCGELRHEGHHRSDRPRTWRDSSAADSARASIAERHSAGAGGRADHQEGRRNRSARAAAGPGPLRPDHGCPGHERWPCRSRPPGLPDRQRLHAGPRRCTSGPAGRLGARARVGDHRLRRHGQHATSAGPPGGGSLGHVTGKYRARHRCGCRRGRGRDRSQRDQTGHATGAATRAPPRSISPVPTTMKLAGEVLAR